MREDDVAKVATIAFFRSLTREWASRTGKPMDQCPVPHWDAIRPIDQASFVRSMKVAISATAPDNVDRVLSTLKL